MPRHAIGRGARGSRCVAGRGRRGHRSLPPPDRHQPPDVRRRHERQQLPLALQPSDRAAGWGAGQLAGGRHLVYSDRDRTPLANLHVTLLDKLGVPVERMGDSTGPLVNLSTGYAGRLSGV